MAYGLRKKKNRKNYVDQGLSILGAQGALQFSELKIFFKNLLQNEGVTTKVY